MHIFKTVAMAWWQIGLLKLALLCIGIAIGAYWPAVFLPYAGLLIILGIAIGIYIGSVWLKR